MKASILLCRMNDGKGGFTIGAVGDRILTVMGSSLPFALADYGNVMSVSVAEGETGVMAVMVGQSRPDDRGDIKRAFLLGVDWKDGRPGFDEKWGFIPPPDRLASISSQGISIRCGANHQDLYYAPNPVECLARKPRPGEKVINCDDACIFLSEKIDQKELDNRITEEIERKDELAELQRRLELAESQRQEEVAARHADWRKFELEFARIVLEKDDERAKYGEQLTKELKDNFRRTPLWRLAWQRFRAWLKATWGNSFFTRYGY